MKITTFRSFLGTRGCPQGTEWVDVSCIILVTHIINTDMKERATIITVKNKYRHNDKDNDDDISHEPHTRSCFSLMYKDLHDM